MDNLVSFNDLLRFTQRHRWRILSALLGTVALVMAGTQLMPATYEATTLLVVKFGSEYVYRPEVAPRGESVPVRDRVTLINTERQILMSQDLIEGVVTSVGVNTLYPRLSDQPTSDRRVVQAAVGRFLQDLRAEQMPLTDVLRVAFRHADPELAARTLNLLIEHFKQKHLEAFSDPQATKFLEQKVAAYKEALEQSEARLKAFQLESKSFSAEEQREALFQQRRELDSGLRDARNQIAGLEEKLKYLQGEKAQVSEDGTRGSAEQNKAVTDARAQLLALELEEQKLLSSFSESSRAVQNVRSQIGIVKDFLEKQKAAIGGGQLAGDLEQQAVAVIAERRFQEARRDNLMSQLWSLERQLAGMPAQDARYRELLREREANEQNYKSYLSKLEDARSSAEMDSQKIANISVIQSADPPLGPIWPSKSLNLAVGIMLGLALGYGWAFVHEWSQRKRATGSVDVAMSAH